MERSTVETVVVGGGVVGAAAARALAKRGASVALLEQGSLSAAAGSSRGTARIFAPAPYPDREYLEMGIRAVELWRELEGESGASLLVTSGALHAGAGVEAFVDDWGDAGVSHEWMSPAEVTEWFGVRGLGPSPLLFQKDAGVIRADAGRLALLESAAKAGVEMHEHERVSSIEPGENATLVSTSSRSWECAQVIVVAGPWINALAEPLGFDLPLSVTAQLVAYFEPPNAADSLPAVMEFDGDEPYALMDPAHGLKAALHARGPKATPDEPWEVQDPGAHETLTSWVGARFENIDPDPIATETCLYTNTPDERFLIEQRGSVTVCSACSGQGFQFAPRTGEILAERAQSG